MRSKNIFLCPALILAITIGIAAQDTEVPRISLSSEVDRSTITIGDLITYIVEIKRAEDIEVKLPSLGANLGEFEIRDYTVFEPRKEKSTVIDRVEYILSTFDVGEFEIPSLEIQYIVPPSKKEQILKTESIKILVESVKPSEEGDIREIKPPWDIPYDWKPLIFYAFLGLLTIFLVAAIILYIRRRRRGQPLLSKKEEPALPPHEFAYVELKRLSESGILEKGKVKLYYSMISEIIRRYTEGRFQIDALELTTTDLLEHLENVLLADIIDIYQKFLDLCDLVKFAKYKPIDSENTNIKNYAHKIIDETKSRMSEPIEKAEKPETLETQSELNSVEVTEPEKSSSSTDQETNSENSEDK